MAELTKQDLAEALDKQLKAFRDVLDEDLGDIRATLTAHTTALDAHTRSLDGIIKHITLWTDERAAVNATLSRHESWLQQIGKQLGLSYKD